MAVGYDLLLIIKQKQLTQYILDIMEKLIEDFSVGLFFWQLILFVGLVLLLKKFAWKPILNSVNEREEGIKDALASAEEAKKEMQNLNASNEQLLKDARAERDALMKDARDIKDKMISDAKEEAKEVTAKLIDNALTSIEQEKQAALAELKNQVAELSIGIAETVIKKELASKDDQLKLVEEILKEVPPLANVIRLSQNSDFPLYLAAGMGDIRMVQLFKTGRKIVKNFFVDASQYPHKMVTGRVDPPN